jgi:GNAT superfamily N-acetyltransferase
MRAIVVAGERVGFLTVAPEAEALRLVHFYLRPAVQGRGLGAAVLAGVIAEAEAQHRVLVVTALRDSDANRFYRRQGFEPDGEAGWDIHYRRMPRATSVEAP